MKKGWNTKHLGDLCDVLDYKRKPITKRDRIAGDYPYYGATGVLDHVDGYLFNEPLVLVGEDGAKWESGEYTAFAVGGKIWVNNHAHVLRPQRTKILDNWLIYYLNHSDLSEFVSGLTVPKLNQGNLREIPIPLAPLPEQQRIVGILDEAFDGIATAEANVEKNLQNARALFESHLQSVFTQRGKEWVKKRLGDLSRISYGFTESASAEKVGPKFLRITDIQDNRVDWATVPYCPIEGSDFPRYKLADGDIVFARTGATTGKSYLVTKPPEAVFASYLIRVRLSDKELVPQFVNLFFQTHSYWDTIRSRISGSAQGGFNATKLGELVIPFPKSSKEQQTIVAKLNSLTQETQRLESIYQRKLAALEALKKSLLHQAFTGKL
jgi:type I restriction enzyme, S subunit